MLGFSKKKNLKIRLLGDPALTAKAKPVTEVSEELRELSEAMLDSMYQHNGIGLAATQVGIPLRLVVLDVDAPEDEDGNPLPVTSQGEAELLPKMPVTLINPEIVSKSEQQVVREEGCLSVPNIYAPVERPERVVLKSQLLDGTCVLAECGGLLGRAVQHELDHLDGIVYVQKVKEPAYAEIEPKLSKIIKKSGQKNFKVKKLV